MAKSTRQNPNWQIKNLDTGEIYKPPFPLGESGLSTGIGSAVAKQDRFGQSDPIVQVTGGKGQSFNFETTLFSSDDEDDITLEFQPLGLLAVKDDSLGRLPICLFSMGITLAEVVIVDNIDYTITPLREDGLPRKIDLRISLQKYVPFSKTAIDPSKSLKESYYLIVTSAMQTYEAIAKYYYGDPMFGDVLRHRNPQMPFAPTIGAKISIPAKSLITTQNVAPKFHALSTTDADAMQVYNDILTARNARRVVI